MNLEKNQIANIVSFFRIVCNLKKIKREGWIHKSKIDSPESVADHSYSTWYDLHGSGGYTKFTYGAHNENG